MINVNKRKCFRSFIRYLYMYFIMKSVCMQEFTLQSYLSQRVISQNFDEVYSTCMMCKMFRVLIWRVMYLTIICVLFWRFMVFIHLSREEKTDEGTNYHCWKKYAILFLQVECKKSKACFAAKRRDREIHRQDREIHRHLDRPVRRNGRRRVGVFDLGGIVRNFLGRILG